MQIRRLILVAGSLVMIAVVVSWLLVLHWQSSLSFKSLPKLVAAMRSYSRDQSLRGRPVPSSVTIQDLLNAGYVSANDVRDIGGADVAFYPAANESNPKAVLVRVKMSDGTQVEALADGSIQSGSR